MGRVSVSYRTSKSWSRQCLLCSHKGPEQIAYSESKLSCWSELFRRKILGRSTECQFTAIWSTADHFITLRARKYINRATRICINFWPSSYYVDTRAQSKRSTKITESEEVVHFENKTHSSSPSQSVVQFKVVTKYLQHPSTFACKS